MIGTFISGLAGPAVAAAAGGRVLGGLRGRLHSAPLKFELLAVGAEPPPGSSLLLGVYERGSADDLPASHVAGAVLLLTYELHEPLVDRLNVGGNVVFPFSPNGATRVPDRPLEPSARAQHHAAPLARDDAITINAATLSYELPASFSHSSGS